MYIVPFKDKKGNDTFLRDAKTKVPNLMNAKELILDAAHSCYQIRNLQSDKTRRSQKCQQQFDEANKSAFHAFLKLSNTIKDLQSRIPDDLMMEDYEEIQLIEWDAFQTKELVSTVYGSLSKIPYYENK